MRSRRDRLGRRCQPWRVLYRGCFLLMTNSRRLRRTTRQLRSRVFAERMELRIFTSAPFFDQRFARRGKLSARARDVNLIAGAAGANALAIGDPHGCVVARPQQRWGVLIAAQQNSCALSVIMLPYLHESRDGRCGRALLGGSDGKLPQPALFEVCRHDRIRDKSSEHDPSAEVIAAAGRRSLPP